MNYHVFELTNEGKNTYNPKRDFSKYVKTLTSFNCERTLVVSYEKNLINRRYKTDYRPILRENDIEVQIKGEIPSEVE